MTSMAWAIRCERCAGEAAFEAPFELLDGEDAARAIALGRPGVKLGGGFALERFPREFPWGDPDNWRRRPSGYPAGPRWGVATCGACGRRAKHRVDWPREAFYQVRIDADVLWAYDRAGAVTILQFIRSADRDAFAVKGPYFLRKIPKEFLLVRRREKIVAALEKLLGG
jgi:hypothetical protein